MNLGQKIKFWYNNSRPYSIPITFLSWLAIFVYSLKAGGNAIYGIIAYFGIALVHLVANLADDYFDYKRLIKKSQGFETTKAIKFRYLKDGSATIEELGNVIIILLLIAGICGGILFFCSGEYVALFALCGLIVALAYSFLSSRGFGDAAVILAYGPLMFEGVYYVMTGNLSLEVLIFSFACAMFVNAILYAHMLMDFDEDVSVHKTTLCTRLKTKSNALKFLMVFYALGYAFIAILGKLQHNYLYALTLLTVPMVLDLYSSLKIYNENDKIVPQAHFWHYPLDNWQERKLNTNAAFFFRFLYARNISTWFILLACLAVIFS